MAAVIALEAIARKSVWVQLPPPTPIKEHLLENLKKFCYNIYKIKKERNLGAQLSWQSNSFANYRSWVRLPQLPPKSSKSSLKEVLVRLKAPLSSNKGRNAGVTFEIRTTMLTGFNRKPKMSCGRGWVFQILSYKRQSEKKCQFANELSYKPKGLGRPFKSTGSGVAESPQIRKIKYYEMAPCFIVKYLQAEGVLRWIQRLVVGNLIAVKKIGGQIFGFSTSPICGSGEMADTVVSKTTTARFKGSNPFSRTN